MLEPEMWSGAPDRDRDLEAPRGESCDVDTDSPRLMEEAPPVGRDLRPPVVTVGTFRGLGEWWWKATAPPRGEGEGS